MAWYEIAVLVIYFLALLFLFLYSLGQLHLTRKYLKRDIHNDVESSALSQLPQVTIQLPIYNEKFVVQRLIDKVCAMEYPRSLLEIQVLDDSTDETTEIIAESVKLYSEKGFDIKHITRNDRKGFKAGALANGLKIARGQFIAIFDADFLPKADFLLKTLANFTTANVGMVQTRWGHVNRDHSFLTKLQAFGLDAHFSIEQSGRNSVNSFINFNGTAGVWRKKCIIDAGGWSDDTLTEDLDLSYRAQLRGWQFKYLEAIESPAELPIIMPAIKSQQYRWNKGAAETSRKNLSKVLRQPLPLVTKLHATFHLLNSSVFLMLLIVGLLSLPLIVIKDKHPEYQLMFSLANVFLIGFFSIAYYFWVSSKKATYTSISEGFIRTFIPFITLSMGLSFHNGIAVFEGLIGRKTPFVRTPKFNSIDKSSGFVKSEYSRYKPQLQTIIEILLAIYFLLAIGIGIYIEDYGMILFHLMLSIGFLTVSYTTLRPTVDG